MRLTSVVDPELPGTVSATLEGHLDTGGATQLRQELSALLTAETPSLLLDLRGVDWITSAGVGALLHLYSRAQAQRGVMALFGSVPRVRFVLHVCSLEAVLNVQDTEAEARERLRSLQSP